MAQAKPPRKTPEPFRRKSMGFLPAGGLIGQQMRTNQARRGFAQARLQALWPDIVGRDIAGICRPDRLITARGPSGGLLKLAVEGALAPQVQMMLPAIRDRINAALGPGTVGRIQIVQAPLTDHPAPAGSRPRRPPPPEIPTPLAESLSGVGDDELRDVLQTLARNVLSRSQRPRTLED
jgi:hypothetical protein